MNHRNVRIGLLNARLKTLSALMVGAMGLASGAVAQGATAQGDRWGWSFTVEGLSSAMPRNEVGIPGNTGTRFDFGQLTGSGRFTTGRFTLVAAPPRGGEWRLMVQPLTIRGTGELDGPVDFVNETFAPGVPTKGTYRFNSYRLTWRNTWVRNDRRHWRFGGTLKIRDAEISMRQGSLNQHKRDFGVVPLLHLYGEERLGGPWVATLDLDGAWSPMGRAIDAGLNVGYDLDRRSRITVGFRVLEGGADNNTVYTFSQFNSWTVGYTAQF